MYVNERDKILNISSHWRIKFHSLTLINCDVVHIDNLILKYKSRRQSDSWIYSCYSLNMYKLEIKRIWYRNLRSMNIFVCGLCQNITESCREWHWYHILLLFTDTVKYWNITLVILYFLLSIMHRHKINVIDYTSRFEFRTLFFSYYLSFV